MTTLRYTRIAVTLHWLIAALIFGNVAGGLLAESLPEAWIRPAIDTHKSVGLSVLGLVVLRLLWRFTHRPPALPAAYQPWERWASHAVHGLLYLAMFALPVSGWLHDSAWKDAAAHPLKLFWTVPFPRIGWVSQLDPAGKEVLHEQFGAWHAYFSYALYALLALHVVGALKHQWVDRHAELQRMSW